MMFIFTSNANITTAASAATRCSHEIYPVGRVPRPFGANVVVIADVHGDMKHFLAALVAANVVDKTPPHAWRKGNKDVLVLLGDLNDRGPDTKIVLEAVHQWTKESMNNGGRVVQLLGNHELMGMSGKVIIIFFSFFFSTIYILLVNIFPQ